MFIGFSLDFKYLAEINAKMDENTQPEPNSDELIMQQQRQIEKEVTLSAPN